jgi:hypothetical protein
MNGAINESSNDYPNRRESNASNLTSIVNGNDESSITKASSIDRQNGHSSLTIESSLKQGGLTGLQNLGNTVIIFFSTKFL